MTHTTNLVRNVHKHLVSDSLSNYLMISCDILSTGLTVRKTQYYKNIISLKLTCKFIWKIKCAEIAETLLGKKKKERLMWWGPALSDEKHAIKLQ